MNNKPEIKKARPIAESYFYGYEFYCPSCKNHLGSDYDELEEINFCSRCGQPLEWEGFKGEVK